VDDQDRTVPSGAATEGDGARVVDRATAERAVQSGKVLSRSTIDRPQMPEAAEAPSEPTRHAVIRPFRPAADADDVVIDLRERARGEGPATPVPPAAGPVGVGRTTAVTSVRGVGAPTQLLPWTDPPTGEVPAALDVVDDDPSQPEPRDDDAAHLESLRDASGLGDLRRPEPPMGEPPSATGSQRGPGRSWTRRTEDVSRSGRSDPPHEGDGATATPARPRSTSAFSATLRRASFRQRSITGAGAAMAALLAFWAGPRWMFGFSLVVVLFAAVELFDSLRRVGYRPATLVGLLGVVGSMAGAYARGEAALPLVVVLTAAFSFLWYLAGIIKDSPTANISATVLGTVWVGTFGSYAALLLREPSHRGLAFLGGAVVVTAVYDTFAYLGGNLFGKHPMAPRISPGKTWEGLVVGTVGAVVIAAALIGLIHPWTPAKAALLGLVVAVVAPIGDLAESMIKRDLGIKDMGRVLPGHGGVFDRFDAMLFVLPATYYLAIALDLA